MDRSKTLHDLIYKNNDSTTHTKMKMSMKKSILSVLLAGCMAASTVDALSTKAPSPTATTRMPNPVIKVMANGMNLLKPAFVAEAKLQASVLGAKIDVEEVNAEISQEVNNKPVVIYTYGLSPFSTEAVDLLESNGYEYEQIELGAEWFLLGGKNSVKRVALAEMVDNKATSLPKVFVNGNCIGGCSELATSIESGEFDTLVQTTKNSQKKGLFSFW